MRQIDDAPDLNGRPMQRGDTVTTVGGGTTGKIKDIVSDDGAMFVEVRPLHRSVGKGIWHAADRLLWLSAGPKSKSEAGANQSSGGMKTVKKTATAKASKPASDPRRAGKASAAAVAKSPKRKK